MKMCSQSNLRSENFPVEGIELLGRRMAGEIWHRLMISHRKPIIIPAVQQQPVKPGLLSRANMSELLLNHRIFKIGKDL